MIDLKRTFVNGKMNQDLEEKLIPNGQYLDALNITLDSSEGSNIGSIQNAKGNSLISDIATVTGLTVSNARAIGAVSYEPENLVYWLVTSDNFDAIFEYNQISGVTSKILLSTTGQLNFSKIYAVTGINYIPASRDLGPYLFWTDNLNPPKRINIARARAWANDDPNIDIDTNVILRPPLDSPKIEMSVNTAADASSNLEEKFVYFAYRYKYVDSQYSSMSPFSAVAFKAKEFIYDYETGDNTGMENTYNQVEISFNTGNQYVEEIQVVFYDTFGTTTYLIDSYNKGELGWNNDEIQSITFSNNKVYTAIDVSQINRLFDNVPLKAKAQELIGNRIVYGNYTQFRDIIDSDGNDILIDMNVELVSYPLDIPNIGTKTFKSYRDYELGIIYTDEYGRMTTVLTSENNAIYVPPSVSDQANTFKLTISNEAPEWATNFRIAIKQPTGEYYNLFILNYVEDGSFLYLRINEADRDKIAIGKYIIFKSSNTGATYSSNKYKILELDLKQQPNFVAGAPDGLYFKVKRQAGDSFLESGFSYTAFNESFGRGPAAGVLCTNSPNNPVFPQTQGVHVYPVYYPQLGDNFSPLPYPSIQANQSSLTSYTDRRIAIEIVSATEFRWTSDVGLASWSASITIPSSLSYTITEGSGGNFTEFDIVFDNDGTVSTDQYIPGDIFIFNIRGDRYQSGAGSLAFTGTPFDPTNELGIYCDGSSTLPFAAKGAGPVDYGGHALLNFNSPIYPGAQITIEIVRDDTPGGTTGNKINNFNPSTAYYFNLEEWFWNEGYTQYEQYDSSGAVNIGAESVTFRHGFPYEESGTPVSNRIIKQQYPFSQSQNLYMLIRGYGGGFAATCNNNQIEAKLTITQTESNNKISAETVPDDANLDIYHELSHTYEIENGEHKISWQYADFTDASSEFPSIPSVAGFTVLGPVSPNNPNPLIDEKHSFNVGENIYVNNPGYPGAGPASGYYDILYVTNYAIIIDAPWPGSGPATAGKVFYQDYEQDQSSGSPCILEINHITSQNSDFNAFAFGNGVESNRILDGFLNPQMKYSQRVTSTIEDYKEQTKETSLAYSGLYVGSTSVNNLNEFNLSQANFKNLDIKYGPIQKLYARDTDLLVLHQDKITKVLYGKNLLVDAVGGGTVSSIPEVLGNQTAHPSEYGISNNPESFGKYSTSVFFTDARRGAVLKMDGDVVSEISNMGMRSYFRDVMRDNPNTQKLGCFDPHQNTYVLAFNDQSVLPCNLSIKPRAITLPSDPVGAFLFTIAANTSWTISSDQAWASTTVTSGYGNQDIYGTVDENLSGMERTAIITITYCDGLEKQFTLTQR